jgi:hypothetical protein
MTTQLAIIGSQSGSLTSSDGSRRALQRALGKADRRLLTDAIQEFAAYVDPSGEASTRPGMAFRNVTAMVYRPAGLNALQRRAKAAGQHARDAMSESSATATAPSGGSTIAISSPPPTSSKRRASIPTPGTR